MRWLKNMIGRILGYGSCQDCNDSWFYKKEFTIWYAEGEGMFPLCQKCFDKLSVEAIELHIARLLMDWSKMKTSTTKDLINIRDSAMSKVKELKGVK